MSSSGLFLLRRPAVWEGVKSPRPRCVSRLQLFTALIRTYPPLLFDSCWLSFLNSLALSWIAALLFLGYSRRHSCQNPSDTVMKIENSCWLTSVSQYNIVVTLITESIDCIKYELYCNFMLFLRVYLCIFIKGKPDSFLVGVALWAALCYWLCS